MGGSESDESSFLFPPGRRPHDMELHDMAMQLAKLHERVNGVVRDVTEQKDDTKDVHKRISKQEDRMNALERKLFFIAGAASTGGGAIGALIANMLTGIGH